MAGSIKTSYIATAAAITVAFVAMEKGWLDIRHDGILPSLSILPIRPIRSPSSSGPLQKLNLLRTHSGAKPKRSMACS